MTRVPPLSKEEVDPILQKAMATQQSQLGLVPESLLTMAHRPQMAAAWANLTATVIGDGTLDRGLKQLVAYVASSAHGCRYCQAHTAHSAERYGVPLAKLQAAFEFEGNPLFSESERAALALARDAALVPNQVTDEHFERLRRYFTVVQIVEMMGVIAMFGWLNRWNDTMATTLEDSPLNWASRQLSAAGWRPEKHASGESSAQEAVTQPA
jgi:uncharacterized peroxidase-related enzyme